MQSRLNLSIKNGKLTADLLSEVKSIFLGGRSVSPTVKMSRKQELDEMNELSRTSS